MNANENQIIVYQPNGVMRIDVRFDGETVWLLQSQIAELFSCSLENVRLHLKNIYACGELEKMATSKESLEVRKEGYRSVTRSGITSEISHADIPYRAVFARTLKEFPTHDERVSALRAFYGQLSRELAEAYGK